MLAIGRFICLKANHSKGSCKLQEIQIIDWGKLDYAEALSRQQQMADERIKDHAPVARYVPPEEFEMWAKTACEMGFTSVVSGRLVRSSYRAGQMMDAKQNKIF
jgi:hypothetical protein